jgi:Lysine methyltransferase
VLQYKAPTGCNVWDGSMLMQSIRSPLVTLFNDGIRDNIARQQQDHEEEQQQNEQQDHKEQQQQQFLLFKLLHDVKNTTLIIELWSECDVAGIASCAIGVMNVIVSDLPDVMVLLQSNINQNMATTNNINNNPEIEIISITQQ